VKSDILDVAIIGGGAAGFFAAINIKLFDKDKNVKIFEASDKLLSKVKISGGGRCNVTNACFDQKELVKNYPRGEKELLGAFHQFSTSHTFEWFEKHGVSLHIEKDNRVFPISNDSQTIINCFIDLCEKLNIEIIKNQECVAIEQKDQTHLLHFKSKQDQGSTTILAKKTVCCIGGFHKLSHYQILTEKQIPIGSPIPSLFTFNIKDKALHQLMGLSQEDCKVTLPDFNLHYSGPLLITHWGLSGPAVLKLSAFGAKKLNEKSYQTTCSIDWCEDLEKENLLNHILQLKKNKSKTLPINTPILDMPKRLYEFLLIKSGIQLNTQWANIKQSEVIRLAETFKNLKFFIDGKTTFKEEFVTSGGVERADINFKTMESKSIPNLYFAGEVIDIDGITGGFNFQAAWTTAFIAAKSCASR
jgi:predicted Rossmann fold flavoprotein